MCSCVSTGNPDCQFVGLAARVYEKSYAQGFGKSVGDSAEVLGETIVDISRVGVEKGHLSCTGLCYFGVGVADMADVVDQVEVAGSI